MGSDVGSDVSADAGSDMAPDGVPEGGNVVEGNLSPVVNAVLPPMGIKPAPVEPDDDCDTILLKAGLPEPVAAWVTAAIVESAIEEPNVSCTADEGKPLGGETLEIKVVDAPELKKLNETEAGVAGVSPETVSSDELVGTMGFEPVVDGLDNTPPELGEFDVTDERPLAIPDVFKLVNGCSEEPVVPGIE